MYKFTHAIVQIKKAPDKRRGQERKCLHNGKNPYCDLLSGVKVHKKK
jgi:hypothetical protein